MAALCSSIEFQSTPVIADGRSHYALAIGGNQCMFQSTPVIADGRSRPFDVAVHELTEVSIHARHC